MDGEDLRVIAEGDTGFLLEVMKCSVTECGAHCTTLCIY